jgi:DNA-binding CsgD family transcriptional regulator
MSQNALVRLIYEAVEDPLLWGPFLTKFADAVRAETAGLCTEDKAGQWGRNLATIGMNPAACKSYEEYFFSRDPWQGRRNVFEGNVETGEQLFSNRELVKTEFYNDFLKPNGWLHELSAVTRVGKSTFSRIFALRLPRSGAFTSEEIGLCSYLAPHLQTATRIRQRIVDLEATVDGFLACQMDTKTLANLSLTPAETRLAIALFKGQSVEAYAKEAGISINTARWHVKQIYAKTGVKRQTELIRILLKPSARI